MGVGDPVSREGMLRGVRSNDTLTSGGLGKLTSPHLTSPRMARREADCGPMESEEAAGADAPKTAGVM